jgi:hypothetical protein
MILTDEATALAEPADFAALPDYSCSLPTGTTIGKRWKRRRDYHDVDRGWVMGEYIEDPDPKLVGIVWRDLEIVR